MGKDPADRNITARGGGAASGGETEEDNDRVTFLYDDAELALLFGTLDVTAPNGKKLTSKTKLDDLPLPVAVWIAKCYREWENSQLRFRWNGAAGVVAPVGP